MATARKKRARRKMIKKYKGMVFRALAVGVIVIGVFAVLWVIGSGDDIGENGTQSSDELHVNAGENIIPSNTPSHGMSGNEEMSTEEVTTEEATENYLRYGDELYNDGEFVVCIDAGHGGNDTGCVGIDDSLEKDDTLMLALLVIKELEERGVKVVTTRRTDVWVDLDDRPAFANKQNADVFISLHRNSLEDDTSVKGFEAWINSYDSENAEELATLIMDNLELAGISKNRGVKKGSQTSSEEDYRINAVSTMPSVLLEMGFMSSYKDNQLYRDNAKAYAKAIADAIIQWSQNKAY